MANQGGEHPKIRSDNMNALLAIDKKVRESDPDSPAVNKRNLKLMNDADKGEAIANNLLALAGIIDDEVGKLDRNALKNESAVDLDDTQAVMERTRDYLIACAAQKNPPNMLTYYSIGLGLTSTTVNEYVRDHRNATSDFILRFKEAIGGELSTMAQKGYVDQIMTIFVLKNLHGFADNVRIEATAVQQAPTIDEKTLAAEYAAYAKANGIALPSEASNG